MVAGSDAIFIAYIHLRRGAQDHPAATARWLGGERNLLLAWLKPHLQNLGISSLQPTDGSHQGKMHSDREQDGEKQKENYLQKECGTANVHSFYQYNDFVCMSNNKWLYIRIFIPCR